MRRNQKPSGPGTRSQRALRVGELLRHAIASVLDRGQVRDPDLQDVTITITEVAVSADLRTAIVYVVPLGGAECDTVVAALRRATPFLRRSVAQQVALKYQPNLLFEADTSFDQAGRIEALLRQTEDGDGA